MTSVATTRIDVGEWITRREWVRQMRIQRHLTVAVASAVLLVFTFPIPNPLLKLTLVSVLVSIILQSLGRGISAKYGYMWGWPYPEPNDVTRVDLLVEGIMHRLAPPETSVDRDSKVRLLDPWNIEADTASIATLTTHPTPLTVTSSGPSCLEPRSGEERPKPIDKSGRLGRAGT